MDNTRFLSINSDQDFKEVALSLFRYQYEANPVYNEYCNFLGKNPGEAFKLEDIPFLPISFFKTHRVICRDKSVIKVFRSSGTTGQTTSEHLVASLQQYETSFLAGFKHFYGEPEEYCILGLLPSYAERDDASLAYMVSRLIENSNYKESGFYLKGDLPLRKLIEKVSAKGKKILLIGVTYALLDLAENSPGPLKNTIIMETGGMKGKRPEMVREAVHHELKKAFEINDIHSEYGMTELFSQAYSKGDGLFETPPWMKVITREVEDPLSLQRPGRTGGINIIDLANTDSCAFIATQDLGKVYKNGAFEILGRFDHADIRGCNLMIN